jgi:spoIIIJ-associated protein
MIKEFIGTGKTIEEATLSAKAGLNAPLTADVKIEIVAMPEKKRFFGLFGGSDAKVKASYDDGKRERKPQPKRNSDNRYKKPEQKNAEAKKPYQKPERATQAPRVQANQQPLATESDIDIDYAVAYLKTMLDGLKVEDVKISAKLVDGVLEMNVECDDYGIIIGRRGETLDSLQYLTSLAIKKSTDKYVRVTLNVANYREKRVDTLHALAVKNANYVARTGRRFIFEPMNPYERRIIHTAVSEIEGVSSRSVGNGTDRKVIIEADGARRNNYSHRSNNGRRQSAPATTAPTRAPKADRGDLPKFGKIEVNK